VIVIRRAPFRRQWAWFAGGFEAFDATPGGWARLTAVLALFTVFLYSAPKVGPLLAAAYAPLLLATLLAGCNDLDHGERISFNPVAVLGRAGGVTLLVLGVLHAAFVAGLGLAFDALAESAAPITGLAVWLPAAPPWLIPSAWVAVLLVEWMLIYAVAAVTLAGSGPADALRFGCVATLRNLHTLLIVGALLTLLLFAGVLAFLGGLLIAVPTAAGVIYSSLADLSDLQPQQ
jgi:hypothetical protein